LKFYYNNQNKMRMKIRFLLMIFCFGFVNLFAFQNIKKVSGTIRDQGTQELLIGCTVMEKGTVNGTVSDIDGKFSLDLQTSPSILIVTFIGYESKEVPVTAENLSIEIKSGASSLDEVTIIGYGATKSRDVTGSVKSLKNENFNKGIINSPEQLLQGKVAGVNVVAANGEPGSPVNISIRGPGGVRSGSTPLFIIDGFAIDNSSTGLATNPLNFINPEDIESIDVLKDASATAIYGARGANGVIIITTRKGKEGTAKISYNGSVGTSSMAGNLKLFTADEFRKESKAINAIFVDDGGNTNWLEEVTRNALTHNHNLGLSGGTKNLSYFGSLGLQEQEGIIKNSDLKRYSGRININQKALDGKLEVEVNLNAARTSNLRPAFQSVIGTAISANPTYSARTADGKLKFYPDAGNPLFTLENYKDYAVNNRILANISPSIQIIKGLKYKLNLGVDNSTTQRDIQNLPNPEPFVEGNLNTIYTNNLNFLTENYLTYDINFGKNFLNALIGHSYQKIDLNGRSYSINKFPVNGIEPLNNPGLGQDLTLVNNRPSGYAVLNELQSFFGRATYQYEGKYLATATLRADGSSKFGTNKKYGVFPSFSLGWRISEESFLKDKGLDLKLRGGWGLTGNQEIPSKITQARYSTSVSAGTSYPFDATSTFPAGTVFTRLANPNIQWEVSNQYNLGFDLGLLNNKLTATVDYFSKTSQDILLEVIPADPVQPAGTFWTNVPNMKIINNGLEIDLQYADKFNKKLGYTVGGNITFIDNVVRDSPYSVIPSGSASGPGLTSATINGYINGYPIGAFYLKEFIGLDDKGLNKFRDVDGDGNDTDKDRIVIGTALPSIIYNFNGSLNFKGFDLVANFNGVSGNKVYDNTANAHFYKLRLSKGVNGTAESIQYPNESVQNSAPVSTRYLKDGAYLRLNNLALAYTVDTRKISFLKSFSDIRFSLTGQNLWLLTKYDGFDPEVNTDRSVNGILSYGVDYLNYPRARNIIFGLTFGF
jgi:TonB-linked SusC/RagA family outer membrane protein